jgi:predicted dehydrogenase
MSETGFTTMAGAKSESAAPEIGIGMLGYAFMGKAHSNAFKKLPYMMYPPVAIPKLVAVAGRSESAVKEAAARYGYAKYYTDWRDLIADENVQLFDNGGPNDAHAEPCIAAAQAGKHILCEKPLARTAEEAKTMLDAVTKAGVKHAVAFNYRFVPAIRQAKMLIESGLCTSRNGSCPTTARPISGGWIKLSLGVARSATWALISLISDVSLLESSAV